MFIEEPRRRVVEPPYSPIRDRVPVLEVVPNLDDGPSVDVELVVSRGGGFLPKLDGVAMECRYALGAVLGTKWNPITVGAN